MTGRTRCRHARPSGSRRVGDAQHCVDASGPELRTRDPLTGRDTDVAWTDVARVMGRPMPFWPRPLRIPELIAAWTPGDAAVRHHGFPSPDVTPLLQMAMLHQPEDPIHRAMIHTAQLIQSTVLPVSDLDTLHEALGQGGLGHEHITIAALPAPQLEKPPELDQTTLRSGWRELQRRDDWLAEQCMEILGSWNGGKNLTHAHGVKVSLDSPTAREFVARLEPTARTAQFMLFDWDKTGETFVDPLTDAPVTIDQVSKTVTVLAPDRLPTTSMLAALILDGDVWVRTQDGTLYPAPLDSYYGLSWGYHGSGPSTLAILAQQLLDDIASPGARLDNGPARVGLRALFETKWPNGTILTRAKLEEARDA